MQLRVHARKIEADLSFGQYLGAGDIHPVETIVRMRLVALQRIKGILHVFCGNFATITEPRFRIDRECDREAVRRQRNIAGNMGIQAVRLIQRLHHQGLENEPIQPVDGYTAQEIGIEAVPVPETEQRQLPVLRRLGIDVTEMTESGGIFRLITLCCRRTGDCMAT